MKFDVIYADNPWKFSSRPIRSGRYDELPYPTLSIKQLMGMNVKDYAEENSALFMWTPSAFIMHSGDIMESWGFKYVRVEAVWEKRTVHNNKHKVVSPWGMNEAEYLLMGIRGQMCNKQTCKGNFETIVSEVYPGRHSAKPQIFRERIEDRFKNARRLEMFARERHYGWHLFGNEVKSDVDILVLVK